MITNEPRVMPSACFGTGPPIQSRYPSRRSSRITDDATPSEQAGCQLLPVASSPGVLGAHELQDVHELLSSCLVRLDLIEQRSELGVVVVVRLRREPCCRRRLAH